MNPLFGATAVAAVFLCFLDVAGGTTVVPPTLDELVERAESVVRTRVTGTRCEWRGEGEERRIVTVVALAIDETIVGQSAAAIELEFLGGELDGERLIIAGQTRFAPGHEDILFVSRERSAISPLVRMMYGRYLIARREDGSPIVARANGVPLFALDQTAAPLGAPPAGEALAALQSADPITPETFAAAVRASALRAGRTDVSAP